MSADAREPTQIVMSWDWWCPRHLEPFRANWPQGAAIGMIELFQRAIAMPAVQDAAHSDADNLEVALARFAPVCCFLTAEDLAAVYAKAGVAPA